MLSVHVSTVRLFLHVLAATIWVGGQLTLAGLVPTLRGLGDDAPRVAARRFARLAWPAYAVLVATGIWNIAAVHPNWSGAYGATLIAKIGVAIASGVAAWAHSVSRSRRGLAVWGAMSGLTAVGALFLGLLLNG